MALHKVILPKSARLLFRVVALQKRLLKALADPAVTAAQVDVAWMQRTWPMQDAEWVRKFCRGGKESVLHPLKKLAAATMQARQSLYAEFCRQNKVPEMLANAGNFQDLAQLPGFTAALAEAAAGFFRRCYILMSHDVRRKWPGYALAAGTLTNRTYKSEFCAAYPTKSVCPYCDQDIGEPKLDHYYAKSLVPLLACNPWNLVPVCGSCNELDSKGDEPAFAQGPPRSTAEWLHPFYLPASAQTCIRLTGPPNAPMPELYSPDAAEHLRLQNHTTLVRTLAKRWTGKATAYCDRLTGHIERRRAENPRTVTAKLVEECLAEEAASRAKSSNTLIHAAVCRAFLDQRAGYVDEFAEPNPPRLA